MVGGATGLIPSQFLEEKRKAFVPRDFDGSGESMQFVGHQAVESGLLLPSAGRGLSQTFFPLQTQRKLISRQHEGKSMFLCCQGILCGTIAGKKKKKMMYLTAKNAGLSFQVNPNSSLPLSLCPFIWHLLLCTSSRVRQARAANLRGGGEGSGLPEEDAGSDWCSGSGPTQSEEPPHGSLPHPLWNHYTM